MWGTTKDITIAGQGCLSSSSQHQIFLSLQRHIFGCHHSYVSSRDQQLTTNNLRSIPFFSIIRKSPSKRDSYKPDRPALSYRGKIITTLIYFNDEWKHDAGRLRLLRSSWDINDYSAEVVPEKGTLIAFRRSERSFHGFKKLEGERRSLQMYYVKPKRKHKDDDEGLTLKRWLKRLFKHRPR